MSAQDLYDALSQQSQIALGYLLGIVDARKGSQSEDGCFTVPWRSDADFVLVEAYLDFWPQVADFSMKAPDALVQMMQERFLSGELELLVNYLIFSSNSYKPSNINYFSELIFLSMVSRVFDFSPNNLGFSIERRSISDGLYL